MQHSSLRRASNIVLRGGDRIARCSAAVTPRQADEDIVGRHRPRQVAALTAPPAALGIRPRR
jgi:hypothetical protein